MAGETVLTFIGNLVADPEIRFLPSGVSVCNFTVANNPRVLDKASGEWKDGDATFLRCNLWRQAGENVVESLSRGDRVIVVGRLKQRSFTDKEDVKRTVFELDVDEVAPSLKYATAKVTKVKAGRSADAPPATDTGDPWASEQPTGELVGASAGTGGDTDSPPF